MNLRPADELTAEEKAAASKRQAAETKVRAKIDLARAEGDAVGYQRAKAEGEAALSAVTQAYHVARETELSAQERRVLDRERAAYGHGRAAGALVMGLPALFIGAAAGVAATLLVVDRATEGLADDLSQAQERGVITGVMVNGRDGRDQ